ncbi:hypothetical protein ACNHYB_10105 [Isoptericola jiangsuensis]|uniref:hypothetical protein n=1 Tax=Isoptericola jiangsuensis TaxID=548579 RepID=UPI003AAFEED1
MSAAVSGRDPRDTLVVVGGPAVSRVDGDQVRSAALRLAAAATALGVATGACLAARGALDRAVWAPAPWGDVDPGRVGRLRWARTLAAESADALGRHARHCTTLSERLLLAAGLHQHAESTAETIVGGVVTVATGTLAFAVTTVVDHPAVGHLPRLYGKAALTLLVTGEDDPDVGGRATAGTATAGTATAAPAPTGSAVAEEPGPLGGLLRTVAPYADEAIAGAGVGVALGASAAAGGDVSVTGGARVLSTAVESVLPDSVVEIEPVAPGEFTAAAPRWSDRPAQEVAEAVARTADLYPAGNGVPGREVPGAPEGTVAVQKTVDADGSVSWLVVVPGTQDLLSLSHPFDVDTDLDLMAREIGDVATGVAQALADAGAEPDEPVVLVGHSLGGLAATSLASSPWFRRRHRLGGVVTAGSPTATFRTPPGVPVLHLENTEELVSPLDGRSSAENPATVDRVTVGRRLAGSGVPADVAASGSVSAAHQVATHLRTLQAARGAGSVQVAAVTARIEEHLDGERAETRYYRIRRVHQDDG